MMRVFRFVSLQHWWFSSRCI